MEPEILILNQIFSWLALLSSISILVMIIFISTKKFSISRKFLVFLKKYSYQIAFIFSFGGFVGSLIYSGLAGFEPCVLCWWQRIFLFPITILLFISLLKKEKIITDYILGLSIPGGIIAFYHALNQLGGPSLTSCTETSGSCSVVYFKSFGYITIPFMAFSVFAVIIIVMLINKFLRE